MDVLQALGITVAVAVIGLAVLNPDAAVVPSVTTLAGELAGAPDPSQATGSSQVLYDAPAILAKCRPAPPLDTCVATEVEKVAAVKGSEFAFALLANVTGMDASLSNLDHQLAHQVGRVALHNYPSATEALRHCPFTMASGCFHGVLEAHYTEVGPPQVPADVQSMCSPADPQFRYFQCLHGLGHGLTMVAEHDLPLSLAWCDFLDDAWARSSCYGGAFMENIQGVELDHHHHTALHNSTWVRLDPNDPLYPCDKMAAKYLDSCYWLQSSAMLRNGLTTAQVFAACDKAPAGFDTLCYQSMGRDISGARQRVASLVTADCMLGAKPLWEHCVYGAVQEMVNNAGAPGPGLAYCPHAPEGTLDACYRGIGVMLISLQPNEPDRAATCDQAGAGRAACRQGARLT